MDFTDQKGKTKECKIWITPVEMDRNPLNFLLNLLSGLTFVHFYGIIYLQGKKLQGS